MHEDDQRNTGMQNINQAAYSPGMNVVHMV